MRYEARSALQASAAGPMRYAQLLGRHASSVLVACVADSGALGLRLKLGDWGTPAHRCHKTAGCAGQLGEAQAPFRLNKCFQSPLYKYLGEVSKRYQAQAPRQPGKGLLAPSLPRACPELPIVRPFRAAKGPERYRPAPTSARSPAAAAGRPSLRAPGDNQPGTAHPGSYNTLAGYI